MQSSFGFRMATVLEYIWRKKKRSPLQQMWLVVVSIRRASFILAKVSLWKREGLGREWFAGLLFYADPSLHFLCYHQIGAILPWAMDEKVKISSSSTPSPPPHASGRRLWALFFAAFVLWISVSQRFVRVYLKDFVFLYFQLCYLVCRYFLKKVTCHQNILVQYMIMIQFDYHFPKQAINSVYNLLRWLVG